MREFIALAIVAQLACSPRGGSPSSPASIAAEQPTEVAPTAASASSPSSAEDVRAAARRAYKEKRWLDCGQRYDELSARDDATISDAYNSACCWALLGRPDPAFERLDRATQLGLLDLDPVEGDPDLVSLHEDPRWDDVRAGITANFERFLASINRELWDIYVADQGDRQQRPEEIDWAVVSVRDAQRRTRVKQIVQAGEATTGSDWFHAAMVMQHGTDDNDYRLAHEWALKAAEKKTDNRRALSLAAAAEDRLLMHQGKPQRFGTQYVKENGRWIVYSVDPTTTDDERQRWNVPTLSQSWKRVEAMNKANDAITTPAD